MNQSINLPNWGLDDSDIATLEKQTPQTLALWYKLLNSWEWIDELGEPESLETYNSMLAADTRRNRLMHWIDERVSEKLISRVWNSKMNDEEFMSFWASHSAEIKNVRNFQ